MLEVEPDLDIPILPLRSIDKTSLPEKAKAMWATVELLKEGAFADGQLITDIADLGINITDEDAQAAEEAVKELVQGKNVAPLGKPASMLLVGNILQEFSARVATDVDSIREMVKNKLIIETEHADAKVRLRALELLGKVGEVGSFVERKEVVHKRGDMNTDELRDALKEKLSALAAKAEREIPGEHRVVK